MSARPVITAILVATFGIAPVCAGETLYVALTGEGGGSCTTPDFHLIQDAVDAAESGDTVVVCAGTYHESVSIARKNLAANDESGRILIQAAVPYSEAVTDTQKSVVTPLELDGNAQRYAFYIRESKFITIQGFEIYGASRAGIRVVGPAKASEQIVIDGNKIYGNVGSRRSPSNGIIVDAGSETISITNNLIRTNGGHGAWLKAGPRSRDDGRAALVEGNLFVENGATGVRIDNSSAQVQGNLFARNGRRVESHGWGLLATSAGPQEITLIGNVFDENGPTRLRRKSARIGGDLHDVAKILDLTDSQNYTTTGSEGPDIDGQTPASGVLCCSGGGSSLAAELLQEINFSTTKIVRALRDAYGEDTASVTMILSSLGTPPGELAAGLRAVFGLDAHDITVLFLNNGDYTLTQIVAVLATDLNVSPHEIAGILVALGEDLVDLVFALHEGLASSPSEIAGYLLESGVSPEDVVAALQEAFEIEDVELAGILLALGVSADTINEIFPEIATQQEGDEQFIPGYCGDLWCESPDENHANCPEDCFAECYGAEALCSRRYDQVLVAGTHNANVSLAYLSQFFNINQSRTLTQQLNDGIRHLDIDIDYCVPGADEGAVCLCHGDDFCLLGAWPASAGLNEIYEWLVANPSEVITLNFEEYLEDADFEAVMVESGLAAMGFRQPSPTCSVSGAACESATDCPEGEQCKVADYWPYTLNNMAKRNQRVVVFNSGYDGDASWVTSSSLIKKTPFGVNLEASWPCAELADDDPPESPYPAAHVRYGLEHVRSVSGLGDVIASTCANATTNILNHLDKCEEAAGRPMNFILVDFYETNRGPLEVVNIVNGVTAIDDLFGDGGCDCHHTEDCEADEFCAALFCAPRLPNGAGPCFTHDMCESDICNLGFCIGAPLPGSSPCSADRACISGDCDGLCRTVCGDGRCELPETCWSDGCQEDCGGCPNGAPCGVNADCASGECLGFICVEPIVCGDGSCDFGETCYADSCQTDCGACPNGTPCGIDADCASGLCAAFICVQPAFCGDGSCDFGETCYADGCQADCGACPNGTPCGSNSDCDSGKCIAFVCVP